MKAGRRESPQSRADPPSHLTDDAAETSPNESVR